MSTPFITLCCHTHVQDNDVHAVFEGDSQVAQGSKLNDLQLDQRKTWG